jgi:hypothetical protein
MAQCAIHSRPGLYLLAVVLTGAIGSHCGRCQRGAHTRPRVRVIKLSVVPNTVTLSHENGLISDHVEITVRDVGNRVYGGFCQMAPCQHGDRSDTRWLGAVTG